MEENDGLDVLERDLRAEVPTDFAGVIVLVCLC